jgi:surfeit locus 1 family protein
MADDAATGSSYRFLARPQWLAFLALGLSGLIVMPLLAKWQLDRHNEAGRRNDLILVRLKETAKPVDLVVPSSMTFGTATDTEWTVVTARGTYDVSGQVLVRNRSQGGQPGFHVLTPFKPERGDPVLVNRGFVPLGTESGRPPIPPDPTSGVVDISGRIRLTQTRGSIGPTDPASGRLSVVNRVDIERISAQLPYRVLPVYIEAAAQAPPAGFLPEPIPLPSLDQGNHLSYAGQWIAYTLIGLIVWTLIIRRQSTGKKRQRILG